MNDKERAFDRMFGDLDGRLRRRKIGEKHGQAGPLPAQVWEPIFCYCGAPGGYVTRGTPIIYVCDRCTETIGRLPLPEVAPGDPAWTGDK